MHEVTVSSLRAVVSQAAICAVLVLDLQWADAIGEPSEGVP